MRTMLIAILGLWSGAALAGTPIRSGGNFGLGIGGGYWFNGLSLKYFASDGTSLQGVIGAYGWGHHDDWYGYDNDALGFTGDFLWEMPALADSEPLELGWNAGLGPSIGIGDEWLALGLHGTFGLELNFNPIPIDLVFEYKPGFVVVPDFDVDFVNFAAHLRVYPF